MAAERGDAEALKQLGDIYEKENALEAVKWYKMQQNKAMLVHLLIQG